MFKRRKGKFQSPVEVETEECIRPAVQVFIDMLDRSPLEWFFGEGFAEHEGGAKIWIGNGDLVWARNLVVPGIGTLLDRAQPREETLEHRELHRAVFAARDAAAMGRVDRYVANHAASKLGRERESAELARRERWEAEGLRLAAARLEEAANGRVGA